MALGEGNGMESPRLEYRHSSSRTHCQCCQIANGDRQGKEPLWLAGMSLALTAAAAAVRWIFMIIFLEINFRTI